MNISYEIKITFKLSIIEFPSVLAQCNQLFRFAELLENIGYPLEVWHPPAPNPERLQYRAFDSSGPTEEMLKRVNIVRATRPETLEAGVWNGLEGERGATFLVSYSRDGLCKMVFQFGKVPGGGNLVMANLLEQSLQIWPATIAEVGPYHYYVRDVLNPHRSCKVFPDRPGVGWMLYLPRRIELEDVPEAPMIRHIKDLNGTDGTIITSVIDDAFDADNAEHVRVANALEIRLADQGLLPRYVDL